MVSMSKISTRSLEVLQEDVAVLILKQFRSRY